MRCARRNTGLVPKRTNLFQQVIAIVHGHLAGDVTVEESAMLVSRSTGKPREVDVVIRSRVAGYEAIVKIEARATGRRADRTWVDGQIGKHADLPPGQLVLVSERGFTPDARVHAEANGVICYAPADLAADDPALGIVKALPALVVEESEIRRFAAALEEVVARADHMGGAVGRLGWDLARGSVRALRR